MAVGGAIVDGAGRVLGQHDGVHRYTVGQRRGLGLSASEPLYVIDLEPESKQVTVGPRGALERMMFHVEGVNWTSVRAPRESIHCRVKIRSRHREADARLLPLDEDRVRVEFDEPQTAVTPGQAAVFYEDEAVLGGGWITRD